MPIRLWSAGGGWPWRDARVRIARTCPGVGGMATLVWPWDDDRPVSPGHAHASVGMPPDSPKGWPHHRHSERSAGQPRNPFFRVAQRHR